MSAEGEPAARRGWFLRHPRTTILALVLAFALAADLVLGALLVEPDPGTFRCLHPYYHHGFRANVSTTTRWGANEYAMHTNSLGFRDRAPREVALVPAGRRIVFLGDSFVEGIGVPYEQGFVAGLERRLGPEVELLNAGAVSYCPLVYRLKTEYLLDEVGLRFGELVVLVDISDIQDQVLYQSFQPHLPGALERAGAATRAWLGERSFSFDAFERIRRREHGGASAALDAHKLESASLADNTIYFRDLAAYQGVTQAEVEMGRWEWTIAEPLMEAWGKQGLELARADMAALAQLCKARGIRLTVVVYPSPVQILMEDLESIQVSFWRDFSAAQGVGFVDLFPLFVGPAAGRPRAVYKQYFIEGDVHWNPAGHERVAVALLEHL